MLGLLAQTIRHPVQIWLLPPKLPSCELYHLPLERSSSFRSNTRWRMSKLSATYQSCSTPRCHRGALARVHSEGEPLCRCSQSVSAAVQPKEGRQVPRWFQQCRAPEAVPYLVGATPKGLSVFRTGNAMCENFEVSEVFGISRRRNSCHCPPGTRAQSGLRLPFPRRRSRVPRRIRTRDGAGSREP